MDNSINEIPSLPGSLNPDFTSEASSAASDSSFDPVGQDEEDEYSPMVENTKIQLTAKEFNGLLNKIANFEVTIKNMNLKLSKNENRIKGNDLWHHQ